VWDFIWLIICILLIYTLGVCTDIEKIKQFFNHQIIMKRKMCDHNVPLDEVCQACYVSYRDAWDKDGVRKINGQWILKKEE